MVHFKRRIILVLLLLGLLCPLLLSCKNEPNDNTDNTGSVSTDPNDSASQQDSETTEERLYADVPTVDYGGYEFRILTFAEAGNPVHDHADLTVDEEAGDIFSDAVYKRNLEIEERFNITIKEIHSTSSASDLQKSISSGTDDYGLAGQRMISSLSPISNGYYMDLQSLPNLDLSKPWYLQNSVQNLTFNGKLYVVLSEMLISPYSATSLIVFNKTLHQDYGLQDPYQMVKDGKWTIDALYGMCKDSSVDLNGDQVMTFLGDQWGFMGQNDSMIAFLIGGGGKMGSVESDGSLSISLADEKNINIMDKVFNLLYDELISINIQKPNLEGKGSLNDNGASTKLWTDGRALFGWTRIGNIKLWREMETPFGMLPMPKYDETQSNYYSLINPWQSMGIGIPVTATDIERTTIILEAMSAESHYTVQPVYFEISLKTKQSRDDESEEMLDYIFANTVLDPVITFNFGDFSSKFMQLFTTRDTNIQSFNEKNITVAETAINKFFESIDSIGK